METKEISICDTADDGKTSGPAASFPIHARDTAAAGDAKSDKAALYLRLQLKHTPNKVLILNESGHIEYCSDTFLRLTGFSDSASLVGLHCATFFDIIGNYDVAENAKASLQKLREDGKYITSDMRIAFPGAVKNSAYTIQYVPFTDDGRFMGAQVFFYDTTELKRAESDEYTHIMLDATPMACILWDAEGNIVDCNQEMLRVAGLAHKPEAFDTERFFRTVPHCQPDGSRTADRVRDVIRTVLKTGCARTEWMFRTYTGEPLPMETTVVRVPWQDSYRVAAYCSDLRAIRALKNDLVRMSSIVEMSPNPALYVGADGEIKYMNPAVSKLTGFTREEILAGGLNSIFEEEDIRRLRERYSPHEPARQRLDLEMRVPRKDGEERSILASIFTIISQNGTADMGFTARDITEMKRLQEELIAAKLQAEQYSRAKSNFLGHMSHEMRTPLNVISGMTNIAETANEERRKYCIEKIDEAAGRLSNMIDDVLDMAKIDMGSFELFAAECRFREIVRAAVAEIAPLAEEKKLSFLTEIDEAVPDRIVADKRRLRQVITRLLSNAVKFTPEKGAISLSAKRQDDVAGKCTIRFEIRDTGIGISAEQQQRLWEAFEQADSGITRMYGGTGLGLAITKRIVEMMDGDIHVESERGKGALFVCTVRVTGKQVAAYTQAAGGDRPAGAQNPISGSGGGCLSMSPRAARTRTSQVAASWLWTTSR